MTINPRIIILILLALGLFTAGFLVQEDLLSGRPEALPLSSPIPGPTESPTAGVLDTGVVTPIPTPPTTKPTKPTKENAGVLFFWGVNCDSCEAVLPFVENLARAHPDVRFEFIDIFENEVNATRYYEANRALNVTPRGVPEAIAGGSVFFGEEEIRRGLPGAVRAIESGRGGRDL